MLTHDAELTAIGAETKINYQKDYDFYLERLLKASPWAISVMEYFNKEVFNTTGSAASSAPTSALPSVSVPRTWEDDLLQEMDGLIAHCDAPSPPPSPSVAPSHAPASAPIMTVQDDRIQAAPQTAISDVVTHASMSISQTRTASSSTQLHMDISHLSLADGNSLTAPASGPPPGLATQRVPARRGHNLAQPAQVSTVPEVLPVPTPAAPVATKRVSGRNRKAVARR